MSTADLRIDKWLWFARFAKTRADAQKLVVRGQVTLNGRVVARASASVRPGDELAIVIATFRHTVKIVALGERRGPAPDAQALYWRASPPEQLGWEAAALPLHRSGAATLRKKSM